MVDAVFTFTDLATYGQLRYELPADDYNFAHDTDIVMNGQAYDVQVIDGGIFSDPVWSEQRKGKTMYYTFFCSWPAVEKIPDTVTLGSYELTLNPVD